MTEKLHEDCIRFNSPPEFDALRLKLKKGYLSTARDEALSAEIDALTASGMAYADQDGRSHEGRVLVVTGTTGSGKSLSLQRCARDRFGPDAGYAPSRFIRVRTPPAFSSKRFAVSFLDAFRYPLTRLPSTDDLWRRVDSQLRNLSPSIIHVDEFQHVLGAAKTFHTTSGEEIRGTLERIKALCSDGFNMIISGLPEVADCIRSESQIMRRSRFLELAPLTAGSDAADELLSAIESLSKIAGLAPIDRSTEIIARLLHATSGGLGLSVEVAKEAVLRAAVRRAASLELFDFAETFTKRTGAGNHDNPFLVARYDQLATTLLHSPSGKSSDVSVVRGKTRRI